MVDVRYRPAEGDSWRAAVSGHALTMLPPEVTTLTAETVWRRLSAGGIGALLEALTGAFGTSLTALPPFALALVEDDGVRIAVRGPVEVVVESDDGTQAVSGVGVSTWTEQLLPGARRLTFSLGEALDEASALPIADGVVPVTALVLSVGPLAPVAAPAAPAAVPAAAAAADPVPAEPVSAEPVAEPADPVSADPLPAEPQAAEPQDEPAPAAAAPLTGWFADDPDDEDAPEHAGIVTEIPVAISGRTDATPADTLLPALTAVPADDELVWGETVARPRAGATADAADGAQPAGAAPTASTPELGDHDGATIAVSELRALRESEREKFESTENVPPRQPSQGRIRLSTGRVVELDRPVVIGRRPKSTRTTGAELPTLVAVDSPEQDISRSHVEIRAEGEHVLVTDLDTTNGTVLLRAGQDPVRLHPGEPTMVVDGDVLDIGDGITVAFEGLP